AFRGLLLRRDRKDRGRGGKDRQIETFQCSAAAQGAARSTRNPAMSIQPEILDLIHAEIDGVASEAELIRLRDAINGDVAVRDEYRRLRGLCDILARVEPAAPPA